MGILEVTKVAAGTGHNAAQSSYRGKSDIASEYSQILAEKIANIKADVQAMEAVQEQLDEISEMHEELTGEVKIDEDSGNANRDDGNVRQYGSVHVFLPLSVRLLFKIHSSRAEATTGDPS